MDDIVIEAEGVRALFSQGVGMNLLSLQFDGTEVIDQSTKELFNKRSAGLGALIGPHFHRRKKEIVPKLDYAQFPKITEGDDPFSHGVARYAPWTVTVENNQVKGVLKGTDVWNGIKLADIEGGDFTMTYTASVEKGALELNLSVVSQNDSLVGTHFYYRVPEGEAFIESHVNDSYIFGGALKEIPEGMGYDRETKKLRFSLSQEADFTFHSYPDPLRGQIALHTRDYALNIAYESPSSENSWQLYRPRLETSNFDSVRQSPIEALRTERGSPSPSGKGDEEVRLDEVAASQNSKFQAEGGIWRPKDSFVCIEPISSWDPRHPNLTVSTIKIRISKKNLT